MRSGALVSPPNIYPPCSRPYVASVKRGSGETYVRSQSLSSESAVNSIPSSVPRRAKKDSNISFPGRTRLVRTQGQQRRSNPQPMPCLPLSPPHRLYVDRCIKEMKKEMKKAICAPPPPLQSKFNCVMFHSVSLHLDNETLGLGRVRVSCIAGIRKGREREFGWVTSRALSASHAPKITFPLRFEHLPRRLG